MSFTNRAVTPAAPPAPAFPGHGIVYDLAGLPVDTSGSVWRLNEPTGSRKINWALLLPVSEALFAANTAYIVHLIKHYSPTEVYQNFSALKLLARSPTFQDACLSDDTLSAKFASELAADLGHQTHRIHYLRKWYEWCYDQGVVNFSAEEAFRLREMSFGGNAKGVAVQSSDPNEGPLVDSEIVALLNALQASRMTGSLSLMELTALWLCVALGCNPQQFVLLRVEDFERLTTEDADGAMYIVRVPRMKKGHAHPRTDFKTRKLTAEIGQIVELLTAETRSKTEGFVRNDPALATPLFSRNSPDPAVLGTPTHEYALGVTRADFARLVARAVVKLSIVSPRTGQILQLSTRRFRYTFATRLVRSGASQRAVAEALDHSDLQNVQVYFDLKSDVVESLDKSMALTLGPLSQAFLGHLVRSEKEAIRGDRPSSRIYRGSREEGKVEPVGTCGSFSFCGLYAPIACYTCIKFQPWVDGPHAAVLARLLDDREGRVQLGLDPRIVALHDVTILAVGDVITRIEAITSMETSHAG